MAERGSIRVGIGGWTFAPWRGVFYPPGTRQSDELAFAGRAVGAIEINATFYGRQKPASFAAWGRAVPDGFRFAVKGSRYAVTRPKLADAGEAVAMFCDQGIVELGDRLGPILWAMAPTRKFDPDDIAAFLALLPDAHGGLPLRHAIQVGHDSFLDPAFGELPRARGVAIVTVDKAGVPMLTEQTAGFAYARLEAMREEIETGYDAAGIAHWTDQATGWAAGGREVYLFMINGAKVRAPAAAQAAIARLAE